MQTTSETSSPLLDDSTLTASDKVTSSSRCHGDRSVVVANSVHAPSADDDQTPTDAVTGPCTAVTGLYTAVTGPYTAVPLAVLDEFSVGVTDTEDAAGESATARCRRSQFGSSRRSRRPTTNGPVSPAGPVVVDLNSNDKDDGEEAATTTSRWDRGLDDDDEDAAAAALDEAALDEVAGYDADDAMLEFAERYFNAQPAPFSHGALARTVNIVTRKSLNVSIYHCRVYFTINARPHRRATCLDDATDRVASSVVSRAKTAEPIKMPFRIRTRVGPRKHVLDESAHRRHLANAIEPFMCGGDAAFLLKYTCYDCYRPL